MRRLLPIFFVVLCTATRVGLAEDDALVRLADYLPDKPGLRLTYGRSGWNAKSLPPIEVEYRQIERIEDGKVAVLLVWGRTNPVERAVVVAKGGQMTVRYVDQPGTTNPPPLTIAEIKAAVEDCAGTLHKLAEWANQSPYAVGQVRDTEVVGVTVAARPVEKFEFGITRQTGPEFLTVDAYGFGVTLWRSSTGWGDHLTRFGTATLQRGVGILGLGTTTHARLSMGGSLGLVGLVPPSGREPVPPLLSFDKPDRYRLGNWQYDVHLCRLTNDQQRAFTFLLNRGQTVPVIRCVLTPWGPMVRREDGAWLPQGLTLPPLAIAQKSASGVYGYRTPPPMWEYPPIAVGLKTWETPAGSTNEPLPRLGPWVTGYRPDPTTKRFQAVKIEVGDVVVARAVGEAKIQWTDPRRPAATQDVEIVVHLGGKGAGQYAAGQRVGIEYHPQPWERAVRQGEQLVWAVCRGEGGRTVGIHVGGDTPENRAALLKELVQ